MRALRRRVARLEDLRDAHDLAHYSTEELRAMLAGMLGLDPDSLSDADWSSLVETLHNELNSVQDRFLPAEVLED